VEFFLILALNVMSYGAFWVVFFTVQLPVLHAIVNWQLHISLTITAQIYSELQFCVELRTKKALHADMTLITSITLQNGRLSVEVCCCCFYLQRIKFLLTYARNI